MRGTHARTHAPKRTDGTTTKRKNVTSPLNDDPATKKKKEKSPPKPESFAEVVLTPTPSKRGKCEEKNGG